MDLYLKLYFHIINNIRLIILASILSGVIFTSSSYFFEEKYLSSSNLLVSDGGASSMQSLSGYQGIASLVGVSLPGGEVEKKINLIVETLKSRDFLIQLTQKNKEIIPDLYAATGFDFNLNKMIYSKTMYDHTTNTWIIDKSKGIDVNGPKAFKIYKKFHDDIFKVYVNPSNNFIALSVEHYSPIFAQSLLVEIIDSLNSSLRNKDLVKAEQALDYLQEQVLISNQNEMKESLYSLIEKNLETIMLTKINKYYAIEPIDYPNLSERKIFPNRKIFLLLGLVFGFFISTSISFVRTLNS